MKFYLFIFIFLLISVNTAYTMPDSVEIVPEKKYDMKTYYMVFLKKGNNRTQDSTEAAKIQKAHLANIQKMADEGKLAIAGPFLDDWDVREIFILNVDSMEEAVKLASEDPAVKAGRLIMEIHPWYSARGSTLP